MQDASGFATPENTRIYFVHVLLLGVRSVRAAVLIHPLGSQWSCLTSRGRRPPEQSFKCHIRICHWEQNLRGELFSSILRQPVEFFDDAEVGVLTSRLGNDCQVLCWQHHMMRNPGTLIEQLCCKSCLVLQKHANLILF